MNLEDYTLSFIDMHQNGMLSEEEVNDFIEEGLYDEEILESYIMHLEEQEEIYQAYLNGEIDDSTISDLLENEYFTNDYADMLIEASLTGMIKSQAKKLPVIGTNVRKNEAMKRRPGLYNQTVGNPKYQLPLHKKIDKGLGNAVKGGIKAAKWTGNNVKKAALIGTLAAGTVGYPLYQGEQKFNDMHKAAVELHDARQSVQDREKKNKSGWESFKHSTKNVIGGITNKFEWTKDLVDTDDEAKDRIKKAEDKYKKAKEEYSKAHLHNIIRGHNLDGVTIDDVRKIAGDK